MQQWSTRLRDDLRIRPPESNELATTITKEVAALADDAKERAKAASQIPLSVRLDELIAFQGWMDHVRIMNVPNPVAVRAQVIYQNYICFVYLGESCFGVLKKELPSGSAAKKYCAFTTDRSSAPRSVMPSRIPTGGICQISRVWSIGHERGVDLPNQWFGSRSPNKTFLFGRRWRRLYGIREFSKSLVMT